MFYRAVSTGDGPDLFWAAEPGVVRFPAAALTILLMLLVM